MEQEELKALLEANKKPVKVERGVKPPKFMRKEANTKSQRKLVRLMALSLVRGR